MSEYFPFQVWRTSGSFYCRIRKYNGLKAGFSVKERKTHYLPFRLTVNFNRLCLFVTAMPLSSAYITPGLDEQAFVISHTTDCKISWVSDSTVALTGYFPRDLIGTDFLSYLHTADLHILKEVFKEVVQGHGEPCQSPPVRLVVKNGCLITISSVWSSFINPWRRHIEFLVGRHTVIRGPTNKDVFSKATVYEKEIQKDSFKDLKVDIRADLQEKTGSSEKSKNHKKLSRFMGNLEIKNVSSKDEDASSRILESSAETSEHMPSYEQLTVHANLTR